MAWSGRLSRTADLSLNIDVAIVDFHRAGACEPRRLCEQRRRSRAEEARKEERASAGPKPC